MNGAARYVMKLVIGVLIELIVDLLEHLIVSLW
jgi:hypothetical protein